MQAPNLPAGHLHAVIPYQNADAAEQALERIRRLTGYSLAPFLAEALVDCPEPDIALSNLERWLRAVSNPSVQVEHLMSTPRLARLVLLLLGASQPLADALIQNPELASLLTDAGALSEVPDRKAIEAEGRRLLAVTTGYSHALDRLRFVRQRWMLPLVVNDLAGIWDQESVWRALSDVADALLTLALEVAWREYSGQKGLHEECPLMIVAFGKLGGRELNYSSDVDLVYVARDGLDPAMEKHVARVCEWLTRAISDRMGRGMLYRVDLRLRPFGGVGPVAPSMRAIESYYASHAEPWEAQALIRSRPIAGPPDLIRRWERVRLSRCFPPKLSTATVESVLEMRERVEKLGSPDDLKRGPGCIRDIEFLTQVLQMVHGHSHEGVRAPATCDALRGLVRAGVMPESAANFLVEAYVLLRRLEHRCQLVGDQQTHQIPSEPSARERLARLMGYQRWFELGESLNETREKVRSLYMSVLPPLAMPDDPRSAVLRDLGPLAGAAAPWLDGLPESGLFYRSFQENEGSLNRLRSMLSHAPALVEEMGRSMPLVEALISGEIEEPFMPGSIIDSLSSTAPLESVAQALRFERTCLAFQSIQEPDRELGPQLAELYDAVLRKLCERVGAEFDVLALGSYGVLELSLSSDLDLLILVPEASQQSEAEQQVQELLSILDKLRRSGASITADLRLRPEGGKGLLARTYDGFMAYELEAMETWERFALGQCRLVTGNPTSEALVLKAAYAAPLTPERLAELVHLKHRMERERVPAKYYRRHIKLGYGGLADLEWTVHLHEMRYPTATFAGQNLVFADRIRAVGQARLLNAVEIDELLTARRHLLLTRDRIHLLGLAPDIVPENPDKLDELARSFGLVDGNAFLSEHETHIAAVRTIYNESMERLRA